ncbi:MAG TPA: triose-phosphate isomerase [Acidimicrobiales bacterium]|nr:triose-phosphate isomerase [Acidimicrobiales bacterium]
MNTRPLVIGNWKMNLDFVEALHLVQQLGVLIKNRPVEHADVVIAPPFVDLRTVSSVIDAEKFAMSLGAQHVNPFDSGAHTGEISMGMLSRLNVQWVIVGHSERRTHYAMSDEIVAETLRSVVRAGQHAVLCVGEDLAIREAGDHEAFVESQLSSALSGLEERFHPLVTIAYEPLWAIGTGVTATSEQVLEMTRFLRTALTSLGLSAPQVLYGGSVSPENAESLVREGEVDGFLVGGASLKAESFYAILRACDDCYAIKR